MDRKIETQKELQKLKEIFKEIGAATLELIEGLLEETAYLKVELIEMRKILDETGMIKINQENKSQQKTLPIANEYRRTINIYALNIKVLNSILNKVDIEEEDAFDKWQQEKVKERELRLKGV